VKKTNLQQQNDLFRQTMLPSPRHRVVLTESVANSPYREGIVSAVRVFAEFTPDNDPHGEHDFGRVTVQGEDYLWKIDYYDLAFEYGADPHTEPHAKVLTVMRAEEY
jgi:hypothetical protein